MAKTSKSARHNRFYMAHPQYKGKYIHIHVFGSHTPREKEKKISDTWGMGSGCYGQILYMENRDLLDEVLLIMQLFRRVKGIRINGCLLPYTTPDEVKLYFLLKGNTIGNSL